MTDLLTIAEVMGAVRLGRSTIYRRLQQNSFPKPLDLGGKVAWRRSDIEAWVASRGERTYRQRRAA